MDSYRAEKATNDIILLSQFLALAVTFQQAGGAAPAERRGIVSWT